MCPRFPPPAPARSVIDPAAAEAAYPLVAPRLRQLPPERLVFVPGDLQVAAEVAFAAARFAGEGGVRDRFARLAAAGEHDEASAEDLANVALAAWYVRHRTRILEAAQAEILLPVSLVDHAMTARGWLLRHLGGSGGPLRADLVAIPASVTCRDLACDLLVLAALCEERDGAPASRADPEAAGEILYARSLGLKLLERLDTMATPGQRTWAVMAPRAWTLLLRTYEPLRRAGRFLFEGTDDEPRFPSLGAGAVAFGPGS